MKQKLFAAIDIGTNAGRIMIGKVTFENGHEIDAQMQEIMTRQINYFFDYEK